MSYRFTLAFDMRTPSFGARSEALYQAALDQCAWADRLGFDACIFMEHHASEDGYLPSPIVMAAAAAARTERIAITISALLLPLYHPVRAAEDMAVLDILSGGRLRLIVGAGYRDDEYAQFGLSLRDRARLMEDGIAVLKQAWSGEPFEYGGRTIRVLPRPLQEPRPAIVMGGSSQAAAIRAARIADGFFPSNPALFEDYRQELARLGKPVPAPMPATVGVRPLFVHISENPTRAWEAIRPHAAHDAGEYARWGRGLTNLPYRETESADELRQSGQYLVLTPDEAIHHARRMGGIGFKPLMGGMDPDLSWESLDLFERCVLPALS